MSTWRLVRIRSRPMKFALTTRWNAGRHTTGEAMIEEILGMGFDRVELGYDTRVDLVPGIQHMVRSGAVAVDSVHNFCPVPMGAFRGHPEIFTLASKDQRTRELAVHHTIHTIRFAAEIGARVVVTHCGNVDMSRMTEDLVALAEAGEQFSLRFEKIKMKLQMKREKKAQKQLQFLYEGLEQIVPVLQETRVSLGMENLPTWEAFPTEHEVEQIIRHFDSPWLRYWHDMGHGQIRENLGFINQERWLERLEPVVAGMHIHDVAPPGYDHLMPPRGKIDFSRYRRFGTLPILRVIEPRPQTSREDILEARQHLDAVWGSTVRKPHPNEEEKAES